MNELRSICELRIFCVPHFYRGQNRVENFPICQESGFIGIGIKLHTWQSEFLFVSSFHLFIYCACTCLYVYEHVCVKVLMYKHRSVENLWELVPYFHVWVPGIKLRSFGSLGSFYLLNHPSIPPPLRKIKCQQDTTHHISAIKNKVTYLKITLWYVKLMRSISWDMTFKVVREKKT